MTAKKALVATRGAALVYKSATAGYLWFSPDARTLTQQLDADLPYGWIYRFGVKGSGGSFKLALLDS